MTITLSAVTLNCPDPVRLADFYAALTGGTISWAEPDWAAVATTSGRIDFHQVVDYQPPDWPDRAKDLLHLDFLVDDLHGAVEHAVGCGAVVFAAQPNDDHCIVLADPAGHPFCLTTWARPG